MKMSRIVMVFVLSAIISIITNGCCKDEPVIIVPTPESAAPIVSGTVTTNDGVALEGALISILDNNSSYSVYTDADGNYSVEVEPGTYSITASKDGYSEKSDVVIAENDAVALWNALLSQPIVTSGEIKAGEDTYIEVPVPPLVKEASSGNEMMTAYIVYETTDEDDELILEFYYDAYFIEETKAASRLMRLINVNYYLSSGKELQKSIRITVSTPAEPAVVKLNNHDVDYDFDSDGEEVVIITKEVGRLTFDYYVDINEYPYGSENVTFEQSTYDNFYGAAPMQIVDPEYSYFTGGTLTGNHVLINSLAVSYTSLVKKTAQTAFHPLDLTLPVGGKLMLSGTQELYATEFDVADGLMHSTVVQYLGPEITAETYNRQHIGGSN